MDNGTAILGIVSSLNDPNITLNRLKDKIKLLNTEDLTPKSYVKLVAENEELKKQIALQRSPKEPKRGDLVFVKGINHHAVLTKKINGFWYGIGTTTEETCSVRTEITLRTRFTKETVYYTYLIIKIDENNIRFTDIEDVNNLAKAKKLIRESLLKF